MMFWIIISIFLYLVYKVFYIYSTRNFDYWKKRGVPYVEPVPLFGNVLDIALSRANPGEQIGAYYRKFTGPYFGFFSFNTPYLVLRDPEIIKAIHIKDFNSFSNRYFVSDGTDPIISNSLFAIKNPTWKWLRHKLSPFMSFTKIKQMLPLMLECNKNLKDFICENLSEMIEVKEMSTKYTTDVMVSCAFGISCNSFADDIGFRAAGKRLMEDSFSRGLQFFSYYFAPSLVRLFKFKFVDPKSAAFIRKVLVKVFADRELSIETNKRYDLVDLLVELKKQEAEFEGFKLDEDNLIAQAITYFAAGSEGSATALALTLHELAVNIEIQHKLREEIRSVIKREGLCFNSVQSMKYLHMVVSETLRKYPATSLIQRECVEEYTVESTGLVIERGTPIIMAPHGLHYDEKYFPEPHKYNPDRFSDSNSIINCSYIPFGEGPRSCVGQVFGFLMVKVAIVDVLRNFLIEPSSETRDKVALTQILLIKPKGGLPLKFRRLNDCF